MTLSKLHKIYIKSVDFVQSYPQEALKYPICIHPPVGVEIKNKNGNMFLKLMRKFYVLKDAGLT